MKFIVKPRAREERIKPLNYDEFFKRKK